MELWWIAGFLVYVAIGFYFSSPGGPWYLDVLFRVFWLPVVVCLYVFLRIIAKDDGRGLF